MARRTVAARAAPAHLANSTPISRKLRFVPSLLRGEPAASSGTLESGAPAEASFFLPSDSSPTRIVAVGEGTGLKAGLAPIRFIAHRNVNKATDGKFLNASTGIIILI